MISKFDEELLEVKYDKTSGDISVHPKFLAHSGHAFCQVCGGKMKFGVSDNPSELYSGWTGNQKFTLWEYCPEHVDQPNNEGYALFKMFRNKHDGKLYTSDFIKLDKYIEYLER